MKPHFYRISNPGAMNEYRNPVFIPKKSAAPNIIAQYNPNIDQKTVRFKIFHEI